MSIINASPDNPAYLNYDLSLLEGSQSLGWAGRAQQMGRLAFLYVTPGNVLPQRPH
jgi:hypothetical protein